MTFADSLRAALEAITSAVDGVNSVLMLYDDFADGFSAVAAIGAGADDEIDGVVMTSDNVLRRVLADRVVTGEALDRPLLNSARILERLIGGRPALLVPLFGSVDVGVAVVRGDELELPVSGRRVAALEEVAAAAAETVLGARLDVEHWCRFREIVEIDAGGIAVVEGSINVVTYATGVFRSVLGDAGMPLLGRPARKALTTPLGPMLLTGLERVRASATPHHASHVEIRDQFGSRYYELNFVPGRRHANRNDATIIALSDRTDVVSTRMALEASIREIADAKSLLSAVLDSTNNGIILVGTDGDILYANRRLADLFEVDLRSMVGRNQAEMVDRVKGQMKYPDAFAARQAYLYDHMEERLTDQVEMTKPTHRSFDRYSGPVYNHHATLLGRIEVYTDVTEVRELQRNKDEFLSVVSHELKTPVTSIKGYAQLLMRRAAREHLEPSTVSSFGVIERQANRMQQLIDTLLDLSRWDLGKFTFEPREINLALLVRHAAEFAGMTSELRRIELDIPDSPIWVRGDERRLEQVVTNLVLNAVRYSPGGEVVTVALHEGTEVRLTVRDRGIGIPAKALPRIFERFYRAPGMTDLTGLGIGLYISKNIIEQHGGRIEVESEVGAGSTFTVRLPRLDHPQRQRRDSP